MDNKFFTLWDDSEKNVLDWAIYTPRRELPFTKKKLNNFFWAIPYGIDILLSSMDNKNSLWDDSDENVLDWA